MHGRDHLHCDYGYNWSLAQQFWERWVKFYLPQLQCRKKWFKLTPNLQVGQMVLVGGPGEVNKRDNYCLGRVACVHPQWRRGRVIVCSAVIMVSVFDETTGKHQVIEIEIFLRSLLSNFVNNVLCLCLHFCVKVNLHSILFHTFSSVFLRFCFLTEYALFHPHFYKSIFALSRLL